jgi:hypothetical protein
MLVNEAEGFSLTASHLNWILRDLSGKEGRAGINAGNWRTRRTHPAGRESVEPRFAAQGNASPMMKG